MDKPIIKWTGSKRSQAKRILMYFPTEIETYYEPFAGGCSVLYQLLKQKWHIQHYIVSDICPDLIALWKLIQTNPNQLAKDYTDHWIKLQQNGHAYYYEIREHFNQTRNPSDFFFLSRTCINGLTRFNQNHEFNSPLHITRKGMNPKTMRIIILQWATLIKEVQFRCVDYRSITPVSSEDFLYIDPPYSQSGNIYYGNIDFNEFIHWVSIIPCGYAISLNAIKKSLDNANDILPPTLYDQKEIIKSGISPYGLVLYNQRNMIHEYLYLRYHNQKPRYTKTYKIDAFL